MEINHIPNYYRLQNMPDTGRFKRTAEGASSETFESYGKDEVAISSDASFKATLGSYAKAYASQKTREASVEHVEELKEAYAGDNCPVSSYDIASSLIKYTFGTGVLEEKGR